MKETVQEASLFVTLDEFHRISKSLLTFLVLSQQVSSLSTLTVKDAIGIANSLVERMQSCQMQMFEVRHQLIPLRHQILDTLVGNLRYLILDGSCAWSPQYAHQYLCRIQQFRNR